MQQPPPLPSVNPYAAPVSRVEDAPTGEVELADRGTRLLAAIVDSIVFGLPFGFLAAVLPTISGRNGAALFGNNAAVYAGLIALSFAVLLGINLVMLHRNGQTIGKRALKVKVVRKDGSRCGLGRIILLRWLPITAIGMIPIAGGLCSLVDALLIFRDDYRCLHDHIADTIVIKA